MISVLYLGVAFATVAVLGDHPGKAPLSDLLVLGFGEPARPVTTVVAVLLSVGAINAYFAGGARLGAALARDGSLPAWLAQGSTAGEVPRRSLAVVTAGSLGTLLAVAATGIPIERTMLLITGAFALVYVVGTAAAIRLLPRGTWVRRGAVGRSWRRSGCSRSPASTSCPRWWSARRDRLDDALVGACGPTSRRHLTAWPVNRSLRPLAYAAVVAVLSTGLLVLAVGYGWLGPDVGRGDNFCEAARSGWVKQPANTWSNLGFVVAGLLIAWRAGRPDQLGDVLPRHVGLATAYACLVVLLGPASAAMHATQAEAGGQFDLLSMYLVASFAAAYALMRWYRRSAALLRPAVPALRGRLRAGRDSSARSRSSSSPATSRSRRCC